MHSLIWPSNQPAISVTPSYCYSITAKATLTSSAASWLSSISSRCMNNSPKPSKPYSFWYSNLPSSFFVSVSLRTALLKSSWLTASL
jgi:hypothetical protein